MITLLDPGQPLPAPTLTRDGALSASALTTWLRCVADASARRAGADWQRAAEHYRAALLTDLRGRVDPKLIAQARQARADRIAAEATLELARQAVEENARPSTGQQSYVEERAQRARHDAVNAAELAMITARRAESAALGALRKAAQPVYCESHDRAAFAVQEATRAAAALVQDAKKALRIVEQVDFEAMLLAEGATQCRPTITLTRHLSSWRRRQRHQRHSRRPVCLSVSRCRACLRPCSAIW